MANLPHRRVSAAMAYLNHEVRRRPNLTLLSNTFVERIQFEGRKAVGVSVRMPTGNKVLAAGEVLVCGGALHSPSILMRSGIGPGRPLQALGIDVISDLPGVGQNLMNHVGLVLPTYLARLAIQPLTQRGFGQNCLRACSGVEGTESDVLLVAVNRTAWHPLGRRIGAVAIEVHKVHSKGEVRLRSADPRIHPEVRFNLLSDDRDLARLLFGFKLCLEIFCDPRMNDVRDEAFFANGQWVQSLWRRSRVNRLKASAIAAAFSVGPLRRFLLGKARIDLARLLSNPAELREIVLQRATPPHHVSCTCRMGLAADPLAVVDSQCRVRGIENLRVIDASIMPSLVRANTHIPVLMIAEKVADQMIRSQRGK